jgi:hypothetical protein
VTERIAAEERDARAADEAAGAYDLADVAAGV